MDEKIKCRCSQIVSYRFTVFKLYATEAHHILLSISTSIFIFISISASSLPSTAHKLYSINTTHNKIRCPTLHESKVRGCDHFLPNIELKNPDSASRGLPPVAATDCFVRVFRKQKLVQSCVFRLKSPEATQVASGSSKINL